MFDKFRICISVEKSYENMVKLKNLPPTCCFRDQHGNILMRLSDNVYSTITGGRDINIYCVSLSSSPEVKLGSVIPYSTDQFVVPLESILTIKENEKS